MHKRIYRPQKINQTRCGAIVNTGSLGGTKYILKEAEIYTTDCYTDTIFPDG
jgi:hypothetical protein